jgi:purine nucleosidase
VAGDATRALVIDTDGGVDDAVALWWALQDPRVELVAVVVTWGNVSRDRAATNVCRILHAAGRPDVPVALGADQPVGPTPLPGAAYVHGEDGLGGYGPRWSTGDLVPGDEPGPALLRRLAGQRPGQLDLVTIGPLSTLGAALAADSELVARLRSLTVMGGAVARPGNALPWGEANVAHDPQAAQAVVSAGWPEPPLLVGLDVTLRALLHDYDVELAASGGTVAGEFLADPLRVYGDFYQRSRQTPAGTLACHDLLAVLAVVEPEVLTDTPVVPLAVDTGQSAAWGATVADLRSTAQVTPAGFAPWRVALDVDQARFRQAFRTLVS